MNFAQAIILGASVGLDINFLAFVFILAVAITTVGFVFVFWSTRHPREHSEHTLAKYEKHWVVIIVIIFAAFSISTLAYLPYPYAHANVHPDKIVDVQGQQFSWCLSQQNTSSFQSLPIKNCYPGAFQIQSGTTVLFNVTSLDVNHDFGVYQCSDASCKTASLLFQVQVMPTFYNQIMYTFTTPGIYYIRCLEFCGFGHYTMISELNITATS